MCVGESVLLGVGRDCGVVAGVPSPARWPGSARGRVGVLGCHGTALVLEALGGGTPCAPVADLGPWKAPFEGLLCSLAVARGPLPPWLLRFLAPKPFAAGAFVSRPPPLPPSACRPGAAPRRAGASQARCGRPSVSAAAGPGGGVVVCRRGAVPPALRRAPLPPARVPGRGSGPRPSAVAVAAARCLRRWLVWGVGLRPGSPRLSPRRERGAGRPWPRRGWPVSRPRPRAVIGAAPVCGGGWSRPSPLGGAAAGAPSSAVAGPLASQPRSPLRAGEGRGEVGSVFPLAHAAGPCAPWWGLLPLPPPPPPHVRPSVLGTSGPPGDLMPRAPPGGRGRSLAHRAPTWLILPVAYACLKD